MVVVVPIVGPRPTPSYRTCTTGTSELDARNGITGKTAPSSVKVRWTVPHVFLRKFDTPRVATIRAGRLILRPRPQ